MAFTSLCDTSGTMELTMYAKVAERYSEELSVGVMLVARGFVKSDPLHGIGIDMHEGRPIR